MDQISLTELRRFYFGPTLAESILYGYDCLQEFFGWNSSAEKENVSSEDSTGLQRIESSKDLDRQITNLQIKTEPEDLDEVNESYGKELVVANMFNSSRTTNNSKRYSKVSNIAEIKSDKKNGHQSSIKSNSPEEAPETLSREASRSSKDIRKSSSIIVEGLKSANKTYQKISDQSSAEQKLGHSSLLSAQKDILPVKFSRELQRTLDGLRKPSDTMVKGSDPARKTSILKSEVTTTGMKANKLDTTNKFTSFDSLGENKSSSKQFRDGPVGEDELILLNVAKHCCTNGENKIHEASSINHMSTTSLSEALSLQNGKFESCLSGSVHRTSLADSKESTPKRPATSPTSASRNSPPSPSPQRRRSSSNPRHSSSPQDTKRTSAATPHQQSRHKPRLTATRWAIVRVNEFDDEAKTYEILPDAPKLLPVAVGGDLSHKSPLDVLRRMQKLQKLQPIPELTTTEVIFATLPGGHTIAYKSDAAKAR